MKFYNEFKRQTRKPTAEERAKFNQPVFYQLRKLPNPVLVVPPVGQIQLRPWDLTLEALQQQVGGYIEVAPHPELRRKDVAMLVNEEGLLKLLPVNENLQPFFYVGNAVFVGIKGEDFTGLTEEQFETAMEWLAGLRT